MFSKGPMTGDWFNQYLYGKTKEEDFYVLTQRALQATAESKQHRAESWVQQAPFFTRNRKGYEYTDAFCYQHLY